MKNILRVFLTLLILLMAIPMEGQQKTIIVGYGESFETIATKYGISIKELQSANPDKDECFAGMEIVVPQPQTSPIGETGITSVVILRADSLLIEAKRLSGNGQYKKAIKIYNNVLDMDVRTPYAYAGRGECYFNLKKYKKARADLKQAIYSDQLADYEKGWCEDALEDVDKAIRVKRERRKEAWANIGLSFAALTAVAATTYVASEQSKMQNRNYQNTMSTYSGAGSDHLRNADQIIAQSNANINQMRAQGTAQLNMMTQNTMIQAQQTKLRMDQSFRDEMEWQKEFSKKNGRLPTDFEVDQWYAANYPDLLESRIMARGKMASDKDNIESTSKNEDSYMSGSKPKTTRSRDCPYCNGSGKIVSNKSVATYGTSFKKKCNICGFEYMNDTAHFHQDCYHCKGTGKM